MPARRLLETILALFLFAGVGAAIFLLAREWQERRSPAELLAREAIAVFAEARLGAEEAARWDSLFPEEKKFRAAGLADLLGKEFGSQLLADAPKLLENAALAISPRGEKLLALGEVPSAEENLLRLRSAADGEFFRVKGRPLVWQKEGGFLFLAESPAILEKFLGGAAADSLAEDLEFRRLRNSLPREDLFLFLAGKQAEGAGLERGVTSFALSGRAKEEGLKILSRSHFGGGAFDFGKVFSRLRPAADHSLAQFFPAGAPFFFSSADLPAALFDLKRFSEKLQPAETPHLLELLQLFAAETSFSLEDFLSVADGAFAAGVFPDGSFLLAAKNDSSFLEEKVEELERILEEETPTLFPRFVEKLDPLMGVPEEGLEVAPAPERREFVVGGELVTALTFFPGGRAEDPVEIAWSVRPDLLLLAAGKDAGATILQAVSQADSGGGLSSSKGFLAGARELREFRLDRLFLSPAFLFKKGFFAELPSPAREFLTSFSSLSSGRNLLPQDSVGGWFLTTPTLGN